MTFLNFTIPSSSPLINYQGQWQDGPLIDGTCASNYSQGTPSFTTNGSDATATLAFVGITPNITIYGSVNVNRPHSGSYSVQLDNEPLFIGNGNDNTISPFPLWNAQNLSNSQHVVVIRALQEGDLGELNLDCISIGREIGPPGYTGPIFNVTLDDESPFITYNGSWLPSLSAMAFNHSLHSTAEGGSSASLHFQGSSIELYGAGAGSFRVQVDNQLGINIGPQFVNNGLSAGTGGASGSNGNPNSQPLSTLLFYTDGLDENKTHVVTLTNINLESTAPLSLDFVTVRGSQRFFNDTPSPNQNFTDTRIIMSTPAHPRRTPVGAIIGGAVGGLIILSLMGLFFLRRRRGSRNYRSTAIIDDDHDTPSGDTVTVTPVIEVTPYIIPSSKVTQVSDSNTSASNPANVFAEPEREPGGANQVPSSSTPEMDCLQVPTLFTFTESQVVESSPQRDDHYELTTSITQPDTLSQHLADQPQENSLVSPVRERDAGRFVEGTNTLPPAYDENWQQSHQPLSSQEANRNESISGQEDI